MSQYFVNIKFVKNFFWIVIPSCFLFLGSISWAYTKIGNGGFVIECPLSDSADKTIEILDVYEGVTLSCEPALYSTAPDEWSKALDLAQRAESIGIQPTILRGYIENIKNHMFFKKVSAFNTRDTGVTAGLGNCLIFQAAIQTGTRGNRQYFFDSGFWFASLTLDQKSVLIIHEALYSYLLDYSLHVSNSELVRRKTYQLLISHRN